MFIVSRVFNISRCFNPIVPPILEIFNESVRKYPFITNTDFFKGIYILAPLICSKILICFLESILHFGKVISAIL